MAPKPSLSSLLIAPAFGLFSAWLRWCLGLGCWGQLGYGNFTFNGDDQLRNDWQYLVAALIEQIIDSQDGKTSVGINFFPSSVEEYGQIVVVVQRFRWYFPDQLGEWVLVVHSDGKVTSVVVSSELRGRDIPLLESSWFRNRFLELRFFLKGAGTSTSISMFSGVLRKRSRKGIFMDRFMLSLFQFFFGDVLFGEISERTMRVFGGIVVFPRFIAFIVLFEEESFELVLTWMEYDVHCKLEARLSRRRELAIELCWSFGSMG